MKTQSGISNATAPCEQFFVVFLAAPITFAISKSRRHCDMIPQIVGGHIDPDKVEGCPILNHAAPP
jgi:hypothetical protein